MGLVVSFFERVWTSRSLKFLKSSFGVFISQSNLVSALFQFVFVLSLVSNSLYCTFGLFLKSIFWSNMVKWRDSAMIRLLTDLLVRCWKSFRVRATVCDKPDVDLIVFRSEGNRAGVDSREYRYLLLGDAIIYLYHVVGRLCLEAIECHHHLLAGWNTDLPAAVGIVGIAVGVVWRLEASRGTHKAGSARRSWKQTNVFIFFVRGTSRL